MTLAVILMAVALVAAVAALMVLGRRLEALATRVAPGPVTTGFRVTVHTKKPDDRLITGLLAAEYPDRLVLVDAAYVTAAGETAIPSREVRIPTAAIAFRQDD